jgi:tryptophan-rich sensory protein
MNRVFEAAVIMAIVFAVFALMGAAAAGINWLREHRRPVLPPPSAAVGRVWDQKRQMQWIKEIA